MKKLTIAMMIFSFVVTTGWAAPSLDDILSTIEKNRNMLDNTSFNSMSHMDNDVNGERTKTSENNDYIVVVGDRMAYHSSYKSKTRSSKSKGSWDGKISLSASTSESKGKALPKRFFIRDRKSTPSLYSAMFPSMSAWTKSKSVKIKELPGGHVRLSSDKQVDILDPALGYAVRLRASVIRNPYTRKDMYRMYIYKSFDKITGGLYYPTEMCMASLPGKLKLDSVQSANFSLPKEGTINYRTIVAQGGATIPQSLASLSPEEGCMVYDYTSPLIKEEKSLRYLLYTYKKGMDEDDYKAALKKQLADAEERVNKQAAAKKKKELAGKKRNGLIGQPHPSLSSIKFLSGPVKDVKELEGKVLLIDFWATWCGPCRRSIPHLKEWSDKYGKQGLVVLGITREGAEVVKPFLKKNGMNYPIAQQDGGLAASYGITGIPQFYIIDRNGKIRHAQTGAGGYDEIEKSFKEALDEKASGNYLTK
jgi:thiol-disulfide isomerase/thioredoxin